MFEPIHFDVRTVFSTSNGCRAGLTTTGKLFFFDADGFGYVISNSDVGRMTVFSDCAVNS